MEFRAIYIDKYGRTVAQVECDGIDVNFELVRHGLA
jgi:endonuclease YncB( thermonuclease family)